MWIESNQVYENAVHFNLRFWWVGFPHSLRDEICLVQRFLDFHIRCDNFTCSKSSGKMTDFKKLHSHFQCLEWMNSVVYLKWRRLWRARISTEIHERYWLDLTKKESDGNDSLIRKPILQICWWIFQCRCLKQGSRTKILCIQPVKDSFSAIDNGEHSWALANLN
jgi:hypothetical protein